MHQFARRADVEHVDFASKLRGTGQQETWLVGDERAGVLYADYSTWKIARGEKPPSLTVWGERMTLKNGIEKKRSGGIKYAGVALRPTVDPSIDEFA